MTALTRDRDARERDAKRFVRAVAAGKKIFAGSLVVLNAAGFAEPATAATGKKGQGRAAEQVDNSAGADGAQSVLVERGCFAFANDGSVTRAHLDGPAYAVDDQTVAASDGGGARSAVGTIRDLDAQGVWVEF